MSNRPRFSGNKNVQTITIMVFIGAALLFAVAGLDPLGLFGGSENGDRLVTPVSQAEGTDVGDWWEVYFSDPLRINDPNQIEGSLEAKLIDYINQAQVSIHIAAFEFNLTPVAEALIAAQDRGVKIRWVTDDEFGIEADEEEGRGQLGMLQQAGIQIKDDQRSALMHNKFLIFDSQIVWTGSTNFTENGIFRNNNNSIVIRSPEVAAIYEREFAEMWAGEFGPRSPSTVDEQLVVIDGTSIQILFAAEDEAMDWITAIVAQAQESIRFMAFSFTYDELGAAMLECGENGVDVRGIFETRGSETKFSELGNLFCAGFPMRQDGNPRTLHHKVIVIDERIVITGSLNFSANANDSNDENVLIIENPAIAGVYLQEFEQRWAEAQPPDPADLACP